MKKRKGSTLIEVALGIAILFLAVSVILAFTPVFVVKNKLSQMAKEMVRWAEVKGSTDIGEAQRRIVNGYGLEPDISWSADYYSGKKVQLDGEIEVLLTHDVEIRFGIFPSVRIKVSERARGKSEVYYK